MRTRTATVSAIAAALLGVALPATASAGATENLSRSLFDGTPERTPATLHLSGPTAGPLGGAMAFTVLAPDGTLPTANGTCETVHVVVSLTVSPGEVLTVSTPKGEACAHVVDGSLTVNAPFRNRHTTYEGTQHESVKIVGDGLLAAAHRSYGGQASFNAAVRW